MPVYSAAHQNGSAVSVMVGGENQLLQVYLKAIAFLSSLVDVPNNPMTI